MSPEFELAPCPSPFCLWKDMPDEARRRLQVSNYRPVSEDRRPQEGDWHVRCGCGFRHPNHFDTPEAAVAAWNHRPVTPRLAWMPKVLDIVDWERVTDLNFLPMAWRDSLLEAIKTEARADRDDRVRREANDYTLFKA